MPTLESLIGARLAVGIPGPDPTQETIETLRQTHAQSLVLFRRNISSHPQLAQLIQRLEEALGWRLLVMIDHEGGEVVRFQQGVTLFPDARTQAAQGSAIVEHQGAVEADELKRMGIHVNLAPCVDVVMEGSDPIIGTRSYGSDPEAVSKLAVARLHGLQSHGVAACVKHFPGLGAVPRDPHKALPTISLDWPTMERVHLPPFRAAIAAGVASVMSSHVCYPALGDPGGLPATFSLRLIRELLRKRMGFQGVILTDALEMGALRTFGTIGEAAVRSAEAGHDVFLICTANLDDQKVAFSSLQRAYRNGRLARTELEASVERVANLRKIFLSHPL